MDTKLTSRSEEYLETILNMTVEDQDVFAARLAERLAVSPPSVSATLQRLLRNGLISYGERKQVHLTKSGRKAAMSIVRRHRLIERLLTDFIGLSWADCHEEACLLEHAISPRVEEKLYERLGRPSSCPHGNPIPVGEEMEMPECVRLDTVPVGTEFKIIRITEEVSADYDMMKFLQDNTLLPGTVYRVEDTSRQGGTITIFSQKNGTVVMGTHAASALYVRSLSN